VAIEVLLFLLALAFLIVTFATALSAFQHEIKEYDSVLAWTDVLLRIALGMFPPSEYDVLKEEIPLLCSLCIFVALVSVFLLNLLVAQLTESYRLMFLDMTGFARLNRASMVVSTVSEARKGGWSLFLESLQFDERLEFNEGDMGPAGGVQILEPANDYTVMEDSIRRYGGPTAPSVPWPEESRPHEESTEDKLQKVDTRLERMEKLLVKLTTKHSRGGAAGGSVMSGGSSCFDAFSEKSSH